MATSIPRRAMPMSPTNSTTVASAAPQISPRRFKIYFQDDAVCKRSQETVKQLLTFAMDESPAATTSNSALLAKKALKYRKVYERMAGVDVTAPEFDASEFLGVAWCKTTSLKAHCERRQVA